MGGGRGARAPPAPLDHPVWCIKFGIRVCVCACVGVGEEVCIRVCVCSCSKVILILTWLPN